MNNIAKEYIFNYYKNNIYKDRSEKIYKAIIYLMCKGFTTAPASTKYHLNIPGGLIIHTSHVLKCLTDINKNMYSSFYSQETIFISAVFHDAHKCTDLFNNPQYIPEISEWHKKHMNRMYNWNEDQFALDSEMKSVLLCQKFFDLTSHEIQAIMYHSGGFDDKFKKIQGHVYPLTVMLHMADLYASHVLENEKPIFPDKLFEITRG